MIVPFPDTPTYVVYHDLILTSKEYMTQVTAVDAYWLGASLPLIPGIPSSRDVCS